MKITKRQLRQIIKEELSYLKEDVRISNRYPEWDDYKDWLGSLRSQSNVEDDLIDDVTLANEDGSAVSYPYRGWGHQERALEQASELEAKHGDKNEIVNRAIELLSAFGNADYPSLEPIDPAKQQATYDYLRSLKGD